MYNNKPLFGLVKGKRTNFVDKRFWTVRIPKIDHSPAMRYSSRPCEHTLFLIDNSITGSLVLHERDDKTYSLSPFAICK